MSQLAPEALVLDEMFAPALAESLRAAGFDVVTVAGHPVLAAAPDEQVAEWASEHGRRVVTENVRDFVSLAGRGNPPLRVLFTSSLARRWWQVVEVASRGRAGVLPRIGHRFHPR